MDGNGVKVDSASIRELSKNLIDETNKLVVMIETARTRVEDSKAAYDSESATAFRTKMNNFAENAKKGTNENLTNLANYFEGVAKIYEKQNQDVKQTAEEYLSTELFDE